MASVNSIFNGNSVLGGTLDLNGGTLTAGGGDFSGGDVSNISLLEATNISATGSVTGAEVLNAAFVSGTTQATAIRVAYTPENVALTTLTLPTNAAKGEMLAVRGYGSGGWKIAQNANQQIHRPAGSTTVGVGGSVDSTSRYDGITLLCVVANLTFVVIDQVGSPTFT